MGHYRVGHLPKTRRWLAIVQEVSGFALNEGAVAGIAADTLEAARTSFSAIEHESAVEFILRFYIALIYASRSDAPQESLSSLGYPDLGPNPTPLRIQQQLSRWMLNEQPVSEYQQLALMASADTLIDWMGRGEAVSSLFDDDRLNTYRVWNSTSSPSQFCEFARLYFSKLTERHLRYFLDRELSGASGSAESSARFKAALASHVTDVSKHAFETSKIAQSFAAGWYAKHAKTGIPSNKELRGFLKHTFEKLREEFRREASSAN